MASNSPQFTDGRLHETEVYSRARTDQPFKHNATSPDRHARDHTRRFLVNPVGYESPLATRNTFTNYLLQSDNFGTTWTPTGLGTIVANDGVNPWDGATTVDKLPEATGTTEHRVGQSHTFTAVPYVLWAIAKADGGRNFLRLLATDGTTNFIGFFNLALGRVHSVSGSGATATIRKLLDGYLLCSVLFTPVAASGTVYANISTDGSTVSYAGDTSKFLHLAQVQLERASAAGPLIVTTTASRSILAPPVDPSDPFAFLDWESESQGVEGPFEKRDRIYSRIPRDQVTTPGNRRIPLPIPPNFEQFNNSWLLIGDFGSYQNIGVSRLFRTSSGAYFPWSPVNQFFGPASSEIFASITQAEGGTYTLTYKSSTTAAFSYAQTAISVQAALNALADVIADGVEFYVADGAFSPALIEGRILLIGIQSGSTTHPVTMDASGLTPAGCQVAFTTVFSGIDDEDAQSISIAALAPVAGHGFDHAKNLVFTRTDTGLNFEMTPMHWSIVDSNTLALNPAWHPGPSADFVGMGRVSQFSRLYEPGSRYMRIRQTDSFFEPGVTPGISVPTDIPALPDLQKDSDFIEALLSQTGWQTYDSEGPVPVRERGILHRRSKIEINLDDIP